MKRIILPIAFMFFSMVSFGREYVLLEEVSLADSTMQLAFKLLIEQRPQCFSANIPYCAVDYSPATIGEEEFHLIIYPADLTAHEMRKLKYFFYNKRCAICFIFGYSEMAI